MVLIQLKVSFVDDFNHQSKFLYISNKYFYRQFNNRVIIYLYKISSLLFIITYKLYSLYIP